MVVKTSFFHLRTLAKAKSYLPQNKFEQVIHAFITSQLDYCNALYYGLHQSSLHRLQMVQNAAAHLLTRKKQHDHIPPVLASLHWLPVIFRIQFKILLLDFKSLQGKTPDYSTELLHQHAPVRALRSTSQLLLDVPTSRLKTRGDRAFSVAALILWKALPFHIRAAQTLENFKSLLKTHLFEFFYCLLIPVVLEIYYYLFYSFDIVINQLLFILYFSYTD